LLHACCLHIIALSDQALQQAAYETLRRLIPHLDKAQHRELLMICLNHQTHDNQSPMLCKILQTLMPHLNTQQKEALQTVFPALSACNTLS